MWTEGAILKLNLCFHNTDWDFFKGTCTVLDELTFCEQMIILRKTIKTYPNDKPCIRKSVKKILNQKKKAFHPGDIHQKKEAQSL